MSEKKMLCGFETEVSDFYRLFNRFTRHVMETFLDDSLHSKWSFHRAFLEYWGNLVNQASLHHAGEASPQVRPLHQAPAMPLMLIGLLLCSSKLIG